MEVDQASNLYTLVDELIRWRLLLDNRLLKYRLDKRQRKELYPLWHLYLVQGMYFATIPGLYYYLKMNLWIIGTLFLSLISPIFYSKSIFAHQSKPHKVTRLIVWLASISGVLAVIHSHNMAGKIFAAIFLARATYLLILASVYGVGGASKLDKSCLGIGVVALVMYAVTRNGLLAITFGVLSDLIGYIPTFVKTWHEPASESPTFFAIEGLASLLGVLAIGQLRVDIILPAYFVLCSATVVALIYRKRIVHFLKIRGATTLDSPQ